MIRERAVRIEEVRHRFDRQVLEHGWEHRAGHSVRRVDHDLERPQRRDVDERQHALDEGGPDVGLLHLLVAASLAIGDVERLVPHVEKP